MSPIAPLRSLAAALAALIAVASTAEACSSFLLRAADGAPVYGRTMELGYPMQSAVVVIPRGQRYVGSRPDARPGVSWTGRFGVVGVNAFGRVGVMDGINEQGLAGGNLYFVGFAGYADAAAADPARSIAAFEFLTWILSQFATVAEVKAAIAGISVIDVPVPEMGGVGLPLHWTLHDATGASIVIEPIGGALKVWDNPLGVMTNAPSFDWHLTNLRNYLKLSPVNAPPLEVAGVTFTQLGQGSGLLGLPGDPTPPSRFVRMLGYVLSAERQADGPATVRLAEHVLNNFDIPRGFIRDPGTPAAYDENTQWSTIADLKNRRFYIKTYDDQVLRMVDLATVDFAAPAMRSAPLLPRPEIPTVAFD